MESHKPVKGSSFWRKPAEILVFGGFSIIFGLALLVAALAVGSEPPQYSNSELWPLVAWAGLGMILFGLGFMAGKSWGYTGSVIIFLLAYLTSIVQAFQREFVWGIFLDPIVLSFLIIPRIRSYFFISRPKTTDILPSTSVSTLETIFNRQTEATKVSPSKRRGLTKSLRSRPAFSQQS